MSGFTEIRVEGIEFVGKHGVYDHERRDGRHFRIDMVVRVTEVRGFTSDRIADTVNYEELVEIVYDVGTGPSCKLIEHLCEKITSRCLQLTHVEQVDLTIRKKATDLPGEPEWVGVRVVRGGDAG